MSQPNNNQPQNQAGNNNQNQNNQPNQPPQRTNPFQRAANNNANNQQNNNNNQSSSRFGSGRFNPPNRKVWTTMPIHKVAVRFELAGLGDPFYRLLGHDLNIEYGDARVVARALEAGGEHVEALAMILDETWSSYSMSGAAMLYGWNVNNWQTIADPTPSPVPPDDNFFNNDDDQSEGQSEQTNKQPPFKVVRAIDLSLVLNVLARARSQVVLMSAPLVFSQQYLNRTLVTDDPRLVALVRATGYLEETYA